MKKILTAFAVSAACASVAHAQTAVTIFGSFDNSLRRLTNVDAAGDSKVSMGSLGVYNSNRIGFKGVEDLGGGMYAKFALEAAFNGGTGVGGADNQLFGRESTVGIGDTWGEILLGRQFSVNARTISSYDPFNFKYLSIVPLSKEIIGFSSDRFNNDLQYTGKFGDFSMRAEYVPGEMAGGIATGTEVSIGGIYARGPISIGATYAKWKDFGGIGLDRNQGSVGGSYTFGDARITGGYIDDSVAAIGPTSTTIDTWIGGTYNFNAALAVTAAYYKTKGMPTSLAREKHLWIVGATYSLSKRTLLYAEIDKNQASGSFIVNNQPTQTGITSGISILF
jgi:predicted porin